MHKGTKQFMVDLKYDEAIRLSVSCTVYQNLVVGFTRQLRKFHVTITVLGVGLFRPHVVLWQISRLVTRMLVAKFLCQVFSTEFLNFL